VSKSVNFIDTRAMKFIKKRITSVIIVIIVIVRNVFRYLNNSQSQSSLVSALRRLDYTFRSKLR